MPRVIALANQKGGTGKTTIATNLAAALAAHVGVDTAVVDLDPQCNATAALLADRDRVAGTVLGALWDEEPPEQVRINCHHERLGLVPGDPAMAEIERKIDPSRVDHLLLQARSEVRHRLAHAAGEAELLLVDTPPSLGLWLQLAMACVDEVLVVARPESFSVQGLGQLLETIEHASSALNPELTLSGVIMNEVRSHTNEHAGYLGAYRRRFGDDLLEPFIPQRVVISSAQRASTPLEFYRETNRSANEPAALFRELAETLAARSLAPARRAG